MTKHLRRREFVCASGAMAFASAAVGNTFAQENTQKKKIIGICCSPRKEMTTSSALTICLNSVKESNPKFETELIELAELSIPAQVVAGQPLRAGETDDFPMIVEKLEDPSVVGIIVGSPVYFGNMTALCKAFLDRCAAFRMNGFKLRNKVAGVLAVGGARNGGQELTIRSIQTALMCQDMVIVGDGQPSARIGGTLWNQDNSIDDDSFGKSTAQNLGKRVAEMASIINR